ncbi:MAG: carbohydrate ABC transporter permease [Candidatus Atribacteria bacterium]|nr:carbohydrate ABC transporter permease [Candidatus Atribacteria bacterium]MCD6350032.1 carbohydrate ABC transporter permease [Candidatus Atribacteria bacterium]
MNEFQRRKLKDRVIVVILVAMLLVYLFPIYWMFSTATKTKVEAFSLPPKWVWKPRIDSFRNIFIVGAGGALGRTRVVVKPKPSAFLRQFTNSIIVAFISTILATLLGTFSGYAFSRMRIRGKDDLLFVILSSRMLPPIVIAIPLAMMYRALGLFDTRFGLIIMYTVFNMGFAVWMMRSFVDDIPREYEEAALVDGYSRFQAFFKFIFPELRSGMVATAIFSLIMSWNEFTFALLLTGENARTAVPAIALSLGTAGVNWGQIAAGSFLLVLPVIVFTFLLGGNLVRGFTFGAIKE